MAYEKTNWQANITPLSPANMNKIEQGIYDAHTKLDQITRITVSDIAPVDTKANDLWFKCL